jgi:V/A-type H+/Na+-transporting ATPase subunit D
MPRISLNKTELKKQRDALQRFQRYLPLLQLKKQQLQAEVERVRREQARVLDAGQRQREAVNGWVALLAEEVGLETLIALERVEVRWDNIAGVPIPVFVQAHLRAEPYDLFVTPLWVDRAIESLRALLALQAEAVVLEEQSRRLARELRLTAQRVNLFEKIKIPEAQENIRRLAIYLGDQQTAAFGWALESKRKLHALSAGRKAESP